MVKQSFFLAFLPCFLCLFMSFRTNVNGSTSSLCSKTPYPGLCNSLAITKNAITKQTEEKTPFEIHQTTLRVTLVEAERAYKLVSAMDLSSFDSRAKSAWTDCVELYQDTLRLLNITVEATHPNTQNDIQTWLSAASTNHQTCQNGFIDFHITHHLKSFPFSLSTFSMFLSNALAVNKAMSPISNKNLNNGRKLLSDGFPEWLSRSDRKLLQSPSSGVESADLVVAQDGTGHYKTVSEAVDASKNKGGRKFVIHVKSGVYKENVVIKNSIKNLMLIGDGIGSTIITSNKNVEGGATTFSSATVGVSGDGFIAKGITFENTAGPQNSQAVAFRSDSDFSVLYGCSFKGYQDTLYVLSKRQFFRNCDIYGTIDFIFGNAVVMFQNCNIYVRKPMRSQINVITAQGRTDPNQNTGIIIHNSVVTAASDLKASQGSVKTYLGRPWQPYSRTVFLKNYIDGLVNRAGWLEWDGDFGLKTLYFGEYMNTGSGSGTSGRVGWPGYHVIASAIEASKFSVGSFLGGGSWIAATNVPYSVGI